MRFSLLLSVSLSISACSSAPTPDAAVQMQGSWRVEPSAEDARQASLLQLALGDPPPSDAQIAAAELSPAEEGMVRALLAARVDNPEAPQIQKMRAAMNSIGTATMDISATEMTFRLGERVQRRPYRVVRSAPAEVLLETTSPTGTTSADVFRLEGADSALFVEPDGEITRLRRLTPGG